MLDLPEPLTPADCDLRGNEWMPLYGDRLFASDTWLMASPEARCAALALWWAGWKQCPAASLPDNDRALSQLAGFGLAVKAWTMLREEAMRGWVKCSDGRLYHPVLAEFAIAAWDKRNNARNRKASWRARQESSENGDGPIPRNGDTHETETWQNGDEIDRTGEDRTGEEKERRKKEDTPLTPRKRGEVVTIEPDGFDRFWDAYPRKVGKGQARKAFAAATKKTSLGAILDAIASQQWSADERYQPHASSWLNGERWLDQTSTLDPVLRAMGVTDADADAEGSIFH